MKSYIYFLMLCLLLLAGFGVRFFRLGESPPTLNWDEAALGYNAYSLLKTGRDEFGKPLPVSLRSFDDYKPAGYAYLSIPLIAIFDLSDVSTRLASVIFGTISIFWCVYIASKLTGRQAVGLAVGAVMAFSPWAMHFSRVAFESNVATSWFYAGLAVFVFAKQKNKYFLLSLLLFVVSMYVYHAQRAIALPTFGILLLVYLYERKVRLFSVIGKLAMTTLVLVLPLGISFLTEPAGSRLASTNILKLWPFAPKEFPLLVFNPIYGVVWQLVGQFMAYYSPANIFYRGSVEPILRVPGLAIFNIELLVFWVMGLFVVVYQRKLAKILLPVLLLAPLPGVVTWNWFSVVRTTTLYPVFAIAIGIGLAYAIFLLKNKLVRWVFGLGMGGLMALTFLFNFLTISIYAPLISYGDFQPGFEDSVPYLLSEANKYDKVIIESSHIAPYIFVLFYGKYPPEKYLGEANFDRVNSGVGDYRFGKFEFRKISHDDLYQKNVLLMGPTTAIPDWRIEELEMVGEGSRGKSFYDVVGYVGFRVLSL